MKEVKERPTLGQWVEMWEYNGLIWSQTCMIDEHGHHRYWMFAENDGYYPEEPTYRDDYGVRFFVL